MLYLEYAWGEARNRYRVVAAPAVGELVRKAYEDKAALFLSYYAFDEEGARELIASGIRGGGRSYHLRPPLLGDLPLGIDFDAPDLAKALEKVRAALDALDALGVDAQNLARVFFSGSKGFHLSIPDLFGLAPSPELPALLRILLSRLFPQADPKPWVHSGLWRAPYSRHAGSGLYKTPLTPQELLALSEAELRELAAEPRRGFTFPEPDFEPEEDGYPLAHLLEEAQRLHEAHSAPRKKDPEDGPMFGLTPRTVAPCVLQRLYSAVEGERHETIAVAASTYRRHSVPPWIVRPALWAWAQRTNKKAERQITEEEVASIVNEVYTVPYEYGCNHPAMAAYCDSACIYYKRKNLFPLLKDASEQEADFLHMVDMIASGKGINLQEAWALEEPFWVYPGELVTVMGATGLGKTALVQDLVVRHLRHLSVWWYDMEAVGVDLLFRRFMQMAHGMTKRAVVEAYADAPEEERAGMRAAVGHVRLSSDAPELFALLDEIRVHRPDLVVLDTLDSLQVQGVRDHELFGKIQTAMPALKTAASETGAIIVVVSHVRRDALDGPLSVTSALGGGAIERKSDKVISIEGDPRGQARMLKSQKARDEAFFQRTLYYEASGSMRYQTRSSALLFPTAE